MYQRVLTTAYIDNASKLCRVDEFVPTPKQPNDTSASSRPVGDLSPIQRRNIHTGVGVLPFASSSPSSDTFTVHQSFMDDSGSSHLQINDLFATHITRIYRSSGTSLWSQKCRQVLHLPACTLEPQIARVPVPPVCSQEACLVRHFRVYVMITYQ
jgi:hypothetical protein